MSKSREIKFRVWLRRWEDNQPEYSMEDVDFYFFEEWGYRTSEDVEESGHKLMQYTGLIDKNGKEIYEGDIVQIDYYGEVRRYVVRWEEEDSGDSNLTVGFTNVYTGGEVIGNIYENPDLIPPEPLKDNQ